MISEDGDVGYHLPVSRPRAIIHSGGERPEASEREVVLGPEDRGGLLVDLPVGQEEGEAAAGPAFVAVRLPPVVLVEDWILHVVRVPRAPVAVVLVLSVQLGGIGRECEPIDLVSQLAGEGEQIEGRHGRILIT
jgi:hypothetical protein